ncbi:MAG: Type prepilin peptidase TadV/CpaA [Labilithrix sp.]|jgi:prepilin peptidase CpaA|nr:Type prepilin peptidase TadV/CpaA [Labilithrix sp.]
MMTTSLWICVIVVLVAVASDIATRRIPNLVTLGGLVVGLAVHAASGFVESGFSGGLRGVGFALLGAVACGIVPFLAWKKGEMGGGDVKLFAAIGALVGPALGFDVEARTFAFSLLVLFPYRLIRHRAVSVALRNMRIGVVNVFRARASREPYVDGPKLPPVILAPAIGIAFMLTLLQNGALR